MEAGKPELSKGLDAPLQALRESSPRPEPLSKKCTVLVEVGLRAPVMLIQAMGRAPHQDEERLCSSIAGTFLGRLSVRRVGACRRRQAQTSWSSSDVLILEVNSWRDETM